MDKTKKPGKQTRKPKQKGELDKAVGKTGTGAEELDSDVRELLEFARRYGRKKGK